MNFRIFTYFSKEDFHDQSLASISNRWDFCDFWLFFLLAQYLQISPWYIKKARDIT